MEEHGKQENKRTLWNTIEEKYSKLDDIETEKENFEAKPYLQELNLVQARTKFKLRSRMLEVKNNYKGEYRKTNLLCEGCKTSIETQDHVLFCPFYSDLRQDIDLSCDKDLVNYYREVMNIRDKLKKGKWTMFEPGRRRLHCARCYGGDHYSSRKIVTFVNCYNLV